LAGGFGAGFIDIEPINIFVRNNACSRCCRILSETLRKLKLKLSIMNNQVTKIISACIACLLYMQAYAQKGKLLTDTSGVFSNMEDQPTYMFGKITLTSTTVGYESQDQKNKVQNQQDIKWMVVYNRVFLRLPRKSTGKDFKLMEIIATNKDYILVQYWYDWYHYYIFDHQGNMVMEETKVYDRGQTISAAKNNNEVLEKLKNYFGDCPELITPMKKNYDNERILSDGIINVRCKGAISFKDFIKVINSKQWSKK
jgi:hypothetical protein